MNERNNYNTLKIKEEEKRKAEEPMSISTKVILLICAVVWILIAMAMCK